VSIESTVKEKIANTKAEFRFVGNRRNLIIVGLLAFAGWAYTGFMAPTLLLEGLLGNVKSQCVEFAQEKNVFPSNYEVRAADLRIKNSKWVVDLNAHAPGSKELKSRTCVRSSGSIEITSILMEGFWR
jgi:hypothetical protein